MESTDTKKNLIRLAKLLNPDVVVKALSGSLILWGFLDNDGSTANTVHRAFYEEAWGNADLAERLVFYLGYIVSLPLNPVVSIMFTLRCGPRVRRTTGKGLLRQFREQFTLAVRKAVPSPWYYMFEFYKDENRSRALEYLYRFETKAALYDTLRKSLSDPATVEALRDKALFAETCLRHGVPAVPALGTVRKGQLLRLDGGTEKLPRCDLFLKPIRGAGGRGASRWTYGADGLYHGNEGTEFNEAGLIDYLIGLSRTEDYVIRALVSNHHDLAVLAGNALSTVRIVTCLDENGHPEVMYAVLRIASRTGVVVDNFHAGGIAAAIDLKTGVLSQATNMGLSADSCWLDTHPVSGAPITGIIVPMWAEVMALACHAHEIFKDHVAIGWDIAVCDQGPLLVEGNKSPDLDIIQRVCREPLGNSRFGNLFLFHIRRALARKVAGQTYSRRVDNVEQIITLSPRSTGEKEMTDESSTGISDPDTLTASIFEIAPDVDRNNPELRRTALATLEGGGIVYLPSAGFELTEHERQLVMDAAVTLPTRRERKSRNGRPTVIYNPDRGHILHARMPSPGREELEAMMARYSDWATALITQLFPGYTGKIVRDRLTYRPCERSKPQGIHVDASYGRPTEGRGMLRVFCNINPTGQARVWRIGETFEPFARRFVPNARPPRTNPLEGLLARLGVTRGRRTAYDHLMADIRGQAKRSDNYQQTGPQRVVSFPEGSAWIAITDLVLHGASSGQHSLDQTFFLPAEVMHEPERSSLRILERLGGHRLV